MTPLIAAANVDNVDAAKLLLARGANPHAKARTGQPATPLMGAAINGNAELVRALLARKPDLAVDVGRPHWRRSRTDPSGSAV